MTTSNQQYSRRSCFVTTLIKVNFAVRQHYSTFMRVNTIVGRSLHLIGCSHAHKGFFAQTNYEFILNTEYSIVNENLVVV